MRRLLHTETLEVQGFGDEALPKYAAVSHTWSDEDLVLADLDDRDCARQKVGYEKLLQLCVISRTIYNLQWVWIDTICVDHSSEAEVEEAVQAEFKLFRDSEICLAHLDDVFWPTEGHSATDSCQDITRSDADVVRLLGKSKWMKRCWTLPELIASKRLIFYDKEWNLIGSKTSLLSALVELTQIDRDVLEDGDGVFKVPVARRMAYAAYRITRRQEDVAYALLGIFGVNIPTQYGEGPTRAFHRLQDAILKHKPDGSMFAWIDQNDQSYRGLLANSPVEFALAKSFYPRPVRLFLWGDIEISSAGIVVDGVFGISKTQGVVGDLIVMLSGGSKHDGTHTRLGIPVKNWNGRFVRCEPQRLLKLSEMPLGTPQRVSMLTDVDVARCRIINWELSRPVGDLKPHAEDAVNRTNLRDLAPFRLSSQPLSSGPARFALKRARTEGSNAHPTLSMVRSASVPTASSDMKDLRRLDKHDVRCIEHDEHPQASVYSSASLSRIDQDESDSFDGGMTPPEENFQSSAVECTPKSEPGDAKSLQLPLNDLGVALESDPELAVLFKEAVALAAQSLISLWAQTNTSQGDISLGKRARQQDDDTYCVSHSLSPRPEKRPRPAHESSGDGGSPHSGNSPSIAPNMMKASEATYESDFNINIRNSRSVWACPFAVMNLDKFRRCVTRVQPLWSIRDVRSHLWDCHLLPDYCHVCYMQFDSTAGCDNHVSHTKHTAAETEDSLEGISLARMQQLAHKLTTERLSHEEQWFKIWDAVFPGRDRPPSSPLLGGRPAVIAKAISEVTEHWGETGAVAITQLLQRDDTRGCYTKVKGYGGVKAFQTAVLGRLLDGIVSSCLAEGRSKQVEHLRSSDLGSVLTEVVVGQLYENSS
jgi:hypothetical protein